VSPITLAAAPLQDPTMGFVDKESAIGEWKIGYLGLQGQNPFI
jgi:hypothetical protein